MSEKKDPCERYCSSCAWPLECAADEACRRREAGEVRSVYPGSDRFLAGSGDASRPHEPGSGLRGKPVFIGMDLAAGPDMTSVFRAQLREFAPSAWRLDLPVCVGEYRFDAEQAVEFPRDFFPRFRSSSRPATTSGQTGALRRAWRKPTETGEG